MSGPTYPAGRNTQLDPAVTAVLIIDMQNMECARGPDGDDQRLKKPAFHERLDNIVIPNQARLLSAVRQAGAEPIFTTIESLTLDGRDRSLDYKLSDLHAPKGSFEARVIDELGPRENEIHIPKTSSNVFCSTNINYVLGNLGIRMLVVAGIVTDQCVEGAVRDAADLGYLVTLVDDACASDDSAKHDDCLIRMDGHFCRVVSTASVVQEFTRHIPGRAADG